MISARTKSALAAAKARGVKRGGPKLAQARKVAIEAIGAAGDNHAANVLPVIREIRKAGATTLREITDVLNARGTRPGHNRPDVTSQEGWAACPQDRRAHRAHLGLSDVFVCFSESLRYSSTITGGDSFSASQAALAENERTMIGASLAVSVSHCGDGSIE